MAGKKVTSSFEKNMARLEAIVEQLENTELPLNEALALFKEGVLLNKACAQELDVVQKEVNKVVAAADGSYKLELFAEEDEK